MDSVRLDLLRTARPLSRLVGEGAVEGAGRDGRSATVRLASGESLEVRSDAPLSEGERVLVLRRADGSLGVAREEGLAGVPGLAEALAAWLSQDEGDTLLDALGGADTGKLRRALEGLWTAAVSAAAEQDLPEPLGGWVRHGLAPLVGELPESSDATIGTSLHLLSEPFPGRYAAEIAGRSVTLAGPASLPLGARGAWNALPLDGRTALWLPAELPEASPGPLPATIPVGDDGAAALLERAGIPAAPLEEQASLGAALGRAAELAASENGSERPASTLPGPVAARVLAAWAAWDGEVPPDSVLRAALGDHPSPTELARGLADLVRERPDDAPALARFLATLPRDGLVLPVAGHSAASGSDAPETTPTQRMAESLLEDLVANPPSSREAETLREALRGLVGSALDAPRDPDAPPSQAWYAIPPRGGEPAESGRIVVHDRRSAARERPDDGRTRVEVSMNPSGLGPVKAELTLSGLDLAVGLSVENPATSLLVEKRLPELRAALAEQGFAVRELGVRRGSARETASRPSEPGLGRLDLRA